MRKALAILAAALAVIGIGGYAAGLFTEETHQRESCAICRATRYEGRRYGFRFEKVEETPLSLWYRQTLDPQHGAAGHEHVWQASGCPVYAAPGVGDLEATCPSVAPVVLLKPETELTALQSAPDNRTRLALIAALNVPDRKVAMERVKLLVEYVYVHHDHVAWSAWWQRYASAFGLHAESRPVARR